MRRTILRTVGCIAVCGIALQAFYSLGVAQTATPTTSKQSSTSPAGVPAKFAQVKYWTDKMTAEFLSANPTGADKNKLGRSRVISMLSSIGDGAAIDKLSQALPPENDLSDTEKFIRSFNRLRADVVAGKTADAKSKIDDILKKLISGKLTEELKINPAEAYELIGMTYYMLGDLDKTRRCMRAVEHGGVDYPEPSESISPTLLSYSLCQYFLKTNPNMFPKLITETKTLLTPKTNVALIAQYGFLFGMIGDSETAQKAMSLLPADDNDKHNFVKAGIALGKARKSDIATATKEIGNIYELLPICDKNSSQPERNTGALANWLMVSIARSQYLSGDTPGAKKTLQLAVERLAKSQQIIEGMRDEALVLVVTTQMLMGDGDAAKKSTEMIVEEDKSDMLALSGNLAEAKKLCGDDQEMIQRAIMLNAAGLACLGKNADAEKVIQAELPKESWARAYYFIADFLMQKGKWLGPIKDQ